jgi:hypothetical protein
LDNDIADREDDEERYHGDLFPLKVIDQMSVEIEQHQLLEPETALYRQASPQEASNP